jgi:hypothetical protein
MKSVTDGLPLSAFRVIRLVPDKPGGTMEYSTSSL